MTSISSNNTYTGDISGGNSTTETMGTNGTTKTEKTASTQGVKSSVMQPIKDMVESLDGEISTQGHYLQDQSQPKLDKPDSRLGDGTINDDIEKSFKLPYDHYEKKLIKEDYATSVEKGVKDYVESQNLPPDQADALMTKMSKNFVAMTNGKTPDLPEADLKVLKQIEQSATDGIKKEYALPSSWTVTAKDNGAWTPVAGVTTKGVDPLRLNNLVINNGIKGSIATFEDIQKAGQALLSKLPPGSPDEMLVSSYLKAISQAIQTLKEFLYEVQSKDAEKQKSTGKIKFDITQNQMEMRDKQAEKAQEMVVKQKMMGDLGLVMKIAGPILSAVLTVVGAATSWLFGAGLLLVAIGVVIGTAATAYAVIDSATNCTQKIFEFVDKVIGDAIKLSNHGEDIPALRQAIKIMGAIVLVAVLAVPILLNPGGAASIATNAAQATAAQVIRSLVVEFIKQISLQIIMTVLIPTISQAVMPLIKETGILKKIAAAWHCDEQILSAVVEGIITAVTMAVMLGVSLKSGKDSSKLGEKLKQVSEEAVKKGSSAQFKMMASLLGNNEQGTMKSVSAMLSKIFGGDTKDIGKGISHMVGIGTTGAEIGQTGFKVGGAIAGAVMHFEMAKLLMSKGQFDAAEESIKGMLDILTKMLKKLQDGLSTEGNFAATLTSMQTKMYREATQTLNNIFQG